jgi:hypothetical protein
MDDGLKRYAVTDTIASEVITMFAVKSNWNFASCEQLHDQTLVHLNKRCEYIARLSKFFFTMKFQYVITTGPNHLYSQK